MDVTTKHFGSARGYVFFILLLAVFALPFSSRAQSSDFKITAPKSWEKSNTESEIGIYRLKKSKSFQTVVVETLELSSHEHSTYEFIASRQAKLENERAKFFARLGLAHYLILNIQQKQVPGSSFHTVQIIQSRYENHLGHEVQMLERQYLAGEKLFRVTYLEEGPALNDLNLIENILNNFTPVAPSRMPAAEGKVATPGLTSTASPDPTAGDISKQNNILAPQSFAEREAQLCKDVAPDDRREPGTPPNLGPVAIAKGVYLCGKEILSDIWGLLKFAYSYITDNEVSDQVKASASTFLAEAKNHPIEVGSRLVSSLAKFAMKTTEQFPCYKEEIQIHMICKTATSIFAAYKAVTGVASLARSGMKLLTGGTMTAEESAVLAESLNNAAPKSKPQAALPNRPSAAVTELAKESNAAAARLQVLVNTYGENFEKTATQLLNGPEREQVKEILSYGNGMMKMEMTHRKIMDIAGSRPSSAAPGVARMPNPDFEKMLDTIPAKNKAGFQRLWAQGGNEVKETLTLLAREGRLQDAEKLIREYKPQNLESTRKALAELRAKMSSEIEEASKGHAVAPKEVVIAAREAEAIQPEGLNTYRAPHAEVAQVLEKYPALDKNFAEFEQNLKGQRYSPQVNAANEIPNMNASAKARLSNLDPRVSESIKQVWNKMNDPQAFARYARTLAEDAAAEMAKGKSPGDLQALRRGEVTRNAVLKVLVKRHRAAGNNEFSTIQFPKTKLAPNSAVGAESLPLKPSSTTFKNGSLESFVEAVRQGPFFDKAFFGERHGVDTHFLQLDYASDAIWKATGGNPRLFWDTLGATDRSGLKYWDHLFDSSVDGTLARPEFLSHEIKDVLKITD